MNNLSTQRTSLLSSSKDELKGGFGTEICAALILMILDFFDLLLKQKQQLSTCIFKTYGRLIIAKFLLFLLV